MLRQVKQAALRGLKRAGAFDLSFRSDWRRQRLVILCYHGISIDDEHRWHPGLYIEASLLEARLQLLADRGFAVLPLDEAIERLYRHDLPPASVAITVDDGHYDFYLRAYPLFRKYGYPVTVYLTSFYTEYNRPIFDGFCSYLLWKARDSVVAPRKEIGLQTEFDLRKEGDRSAAWRAVKDFTIRERLKADQKDQVLQSLAGHLGISFEALVSRRILHNLNPREVSEIAKDGVSIQLHTHRHRTPLDRDLFIREIRDNRASIVEMTGKSPNHFCYPSGVYRPEFLGWLAESGVVSATTCDSGLNDSGANPLMLSRILDHSGLQPVEVEGWLTGCSAWLPHRKPSARAGD